MRVSRVSTKEKRRYALDNLGGVDFSSSLLLCAPNRSPDAVNWIGDHGINRKRNGWEQVCDTIKGAKINGIFPIDKTHILIKADSKFYVHEIRSGNRKVINTDNGQGDGLSSAFRSGNLMYIVGRGAIRVFDTSAKFDNDDNNEDLKKAFVALDPYIPTTTINIDRSDGSSTVPDVREVKDKVNLLTPRRRNTLVGFSDYNITGTGKNYTEYKLDGRMAQNRGLILVTATVANGDTTKTITMQNDPKSNDSTHPWNHFYFLDENEVRKYVGMIIHRGAGNAIISFYNENEGFTFPPPVEGDANIMVEFEAEIEDCTSYINDCTIGTLYGYGGAHDRLFLSGNPNFPNVIFFSEENDFSYFPDQYTITLGGEDDPVKGFVYLSDSTLAALCERSVYYIGGEARTEYDESGNIKRITPVFSRQAGAINEGALNAFCTANFGGDNVFLSRHGLFGIEPTSNVLTNTRTARDRSYAINARLSGISLTNAAVIAHGKKLYVSVGDENGGCFVADSAYKYTPTGSESYNYEWWYWTHVPARVWAEVNGELWFGTADGRVCRFTDGYTDVAFDYSLKGETVVEVTIDDYGNISYYDADDLAVIAPGKRVQIEGGWNAEIKETGEKISLTDHTNLYVHSVETDDGVHYMHLSRYPDSGEEETLLLESGTPILRVYDDRPVVAEWVSPPLDLGNDSAAKTLYSLTVTAEAGHKSRLTFGYETRKGGAERLALGLGKFDFNDFDFADFEFETGFQNSYTVRARDRNFNFIRFLLKSEGDRPCAVHRISAIYKINKYNKGVV